MLIYAYDRYAKDCCLCVGQEKPYYYQAVKTRLMQLGISFDKIACFTRRAFKKICCFSKKLENRFKAFDLVFHQTFCETKPFIDNPSD